MGFEVEAAILASKPLRSHFEARMAASTSNFEPGPTLAGESGFEVASKPFRSQNGCFNIILHITSMTWNLMLKIFLNGHVTILTLDPVYYEYDMDILFYCLVTTLARHSSF